jgi:hypothetical protein
MNERQAGASIAQPRLFELRLSISQRAAMATVTVTVLTSALDTTNADEFYMVRDDVLPLDPLGGTLCVGCLEEPIGRQLTPADFTDASINRDSWRHSSRLRPRRGYVG